MLKRTRSDGLDLLFSEDLKNNHGILVAFTGRLGGVSTGSCSSLNLGFNKSDDDDQVRENRAVLARTLGFDIGKLTFGEQVHGDNIAVVDDVLAGSGSLSADRAIKKTDALITSSNDLPIAVITADCVPIVIVDPVKRVVATVHAGWRGTIKEIAVKTVRRMESDFSISRNDLLVFIGPSIRACSYEVSDDLHLSFKKSFPDIIGDEKRLDLPIINIYQLIGAGLRSDNIYDSSICTYCESDHFFSFRKDNDTGRQGSIALLGS